MVYYFKAVVSSGRGNDEYSDFVTSDDTTEYTIYMGKDKFENDPLIKKSNSKNLWFHVDKFSSAHLYIQMSPELQEVDFQLLELPEDLLTQIGQLTKANSIKANKLNNITIIYTPVDNLHTDGSMDTGTVTFKNPQKIKRIHIAKRENSIVNKLNKTKTEVTTEEFIKSQEKLLKKEKPKKEYSYESKPKATTSKMDAYADLMSEENINANNNQFRNENWVEDDFW